MINRLKKYMTKRNGEWTPNDGVVLIDKDGDQIIAICKSTRPVYNDPNFRYQVKYIDKTEGIVKYYGTKNGLKNITAFVAVPK